MSGNKHDFRAEGYYPIDKISGTKIYTQEIAVIELYPSSYNPPSLERLASENAFTHLEIDTKKKTIIQKGNAPYNSNKKIRKGIK